MLYKPIFFQYIEYSAIELISTQILVVAIRTVKVRYYKISTQIPESI